MCCVAFAQDECLFVIFVIEFLRASRNMVYYKVESVCMFFLFFCLLSFALKRVPKLRNQSSTKTGNFKDRKRNESAKGSEKA